MSRKRANCQSGGRAAPSGTLCGDVLISSDAARLLLADLAKMPKPIANWKSPDELVVIRVYLGRSTIPVGQPEPDVKHIMYCGEFVPEDRPWLIASVDSTTHYGKRRKEQTGWFMTNDLAGIYACSGGQWFECEVFPDLSGVFGYGSISPCNTPMHEEPSKYLDQAVGSVVSEEVLNKVEYES